MAVVLETTGKLVFVTLSCEVVTIDCLMSSSQSGGPGETRDSETRDSETRDMVAIEVERPRNRAMEVLALSTLQVWADQDTDIAFSFRRRLARTVELTGRDARVMLDLRDITGLPAASRLKSR